jgi:hypothetical protein
VDAQKAVTPEVTQLAPEPSAAVQPVPTEMPVSSVAAVAASPALDLLKKAHAQLIERKQSIEAELARMADLTKELTSTSQFRRVFARVLVPSLVPATRLF